MHTTTPTAPTVLEQHCSALRADGDALTTRAKALAAAGDLEGAVALLRTADLLGVSAHLIAGMVAA